MAHDQADRTDRRTFLRSGTLAVSTAIGMVPRLEAQNAAAKPAELPKRKLGGTGIDVTLLNQGSVLGAGFDRILRLSFAAGVRMFDTAKVYKNEHIFKAWFEQDPAVRKQIVLVTKDMPREPRVMTRMLDERLAALGVDHVDLFFIHGLGDYHSVDQAVNLVKSREFKEVADAIRKSGKARFVGFSTHHKDRPAMIEAAAEAGTVDAIMLQYAPWLAKDAPLNRALDLAWKKGIGLITMKQIAGKFYGDKPKGNILDDVKRRVPVLAERKLTPWQGLLHAIWTDERISTSCVSMRNSDQIRQNTDAARRFEPLATSDIHQLRDAALAHRPTLCADCDGRCASAAGTNAALGDLTRLLTYHAHHGDRAEARRLYAALAPEARDWSGADLEAAHAACPGGLDFASLLPEVDRRLA
jgi:uncharacterized protein